ncbi:PB1 domain-containing protein [Citrus sinensis]|uniref:PB1 domain-containing protein n=1 Tax=Citrus sinensis TaxID=2711 RepID=A0ACB8NVV3_CITSI|nr:PB1 domain-containing protein [Citrus sinensis]
MDPPPLPSLSTAPTTTATVAAPVPTSTYLTYPDSVESSPRSRNADTYDDNNPLPEVPGARLRLMCSYGGHIIPRPHDKSLCYSLCSRLSRSLVNGRSFTLKYQLPNEDLDSLVSITTDEDLENMIEEYDRLMATSASALQTSSRIRLFLFFNMPQTAASMGSFLDDAKSETCIFSQHVDALNGSGLLPRGHSDTTMECLLNLDSENDLEGAQLEADHDHNKQVQCSLPDSPLVENSSSFGSSSSSPSMSNLPPIRVRAEDQRNGAIEEQFAQMSFAHSGLRKQQQQEEGGVVFSGAPPLMPTAVATALPPMPVALPTENTSRVLSDDERSDHGVPAGRLRKPPLPLQTVQYRACAAYNVPSPDSVASDSSIASAASSLSKPSYQQDQDGVASGENRGPNSPTTGSNIPIPSPQTPDSGYVSSAQMDQQQQQQPQQQHYIHASMHYIPHQATTPVPISSYYPVYASPQQQILHHRPIDQQYPVYVMSPAQTQAPYASMQPNIAEANNVAASSRALTAVYKEGTPPIYPPKTATQPKPEMQQQYLGYSQIPANQIQQQFVGYSQMQHPSHSIAVAFAAIANYGYEYANPVSHEQVYYTEHQASPLPSHYQIMTAAAAVAALADASKQLPVDSSNHQIRITPSQPL